MRSRCARSVGLSALVAYWTGELGEREADFEEHLLGCARCTERLQLVADLGTGIAALAAGGKVFASLTGEHLDRARQGGLQVRTYRLRPGESVACTIAPDDDANAIRLAADFAGAGRVDLDILVVEDTGARHSETIEDLAVDRLSGEAVLLYPGDAIRGLPRSTFQLELRAVGSGAPRRLGTYTLHHEPWPAE